jgi:hypothetical protein
MRNLAMLRKLVSGTLTTLHDCDRTSEGDYVLTETLWERISSLELDMCDGASEEWIRSVGRRKTDKVILASTSTKFYQNKDFDCIWLR